MNFMEVSIGTSSTEEFSSKPCLITRWYINCFFAQNDDSNLKLLKHFTSLIFLVCFSQRYKVSFVTLRALLLHRQIGLKLKHLHLIVGLPKIFQTESIRINDSSSPHECLLNLVQSPLVCYQFPLELFGQPFKASWGC